LTVVAFDDGLPANFTGGGYPTLNDAGEVAFDGGCAFQTVVESSASGLSVIASTQFPSPWVTLTSCAINDQGVVLIRAWDGGGPVVTAGQHPVNDRILGGKSSGGDPLFGSRVQSIEVSHDALNNAGEVALAVSLVDGRRTIVRASPVGAPLGTSYCEGSAGCPCNNNSASGSGRGCANTNGIGARLVAHGSTSVGANDLWFSADFLTGSTALLFLGTSVVNTPLGDGLKCAGGAITRLGVRAPDAELQSSWSHALASIGGWNAGDTRRFQVWYRSGSTSPCPMPKDINFSNAVEITFTP
jgi:hypothetical protein